MHTSAAQLGKVEYNQLSVRLELQADYLAGVWAHHAQRLRKILSRATSRRPSTPPTAIGDDRLQMQSRGYVVPDSFTHGTSEQRALVQTRPANRRPVQGDTFKVKESDL